MKRTKLWVASLILTATVACGGRNAGGNAGDSGITGTGTPSAPPQVTAINPANNATDVNRDSAIVITFNMPVNAATFNLNSDTNCSGAFQLSTDSAFGSCVAMNTLVTTSGNTATVRAASLLAASTLHYVRITTAVQSTGGTAIQSQFEAQFTAGSSITPYTNEFGTDCSAGAGTISAFKTAATGTEGAVGPFSINGLVVTGIDRFGSFYLQKGTDAIYVDVSTAANACGGSNCEGNKASHYGMQVGDEICLSITRAVESQSVDTVKDFSAIRKTGVSSVTPLVLTDVFTTATISRWVQISGYLTTKITGGGNVNHTLTFADGKTITVRDNSSNKLTSVNENAYIQITSVAGWFGSTPQIMIDTGVGSVSTGLTAPSYSVTGTVSGWSSGENFTLTLNAANATVISANGAFSFTGNPTVSGQYTVAISVQPANNECVISNASGYATANISNVSIACTPKPMYRMTSWADTEAAGTYPLAMQFYRKSGTGTDETALMTVDAPYTLAYTAAYNLTSGARLLGKGDDGFSFLNSGSTADTYLGTAVLTLDTIGKTAMRLNWTGRSITALARPYRIAVQTRPSPSGSWTNTGSFYAANATAGHNQSFSAVDISAIDNQIQGQVRFVYYQEGAGSGARPELAVDDVVVYSTSNAKAWLTAFSPTVSATGVSTAASVSVTFNTAMNPASVTTSSLYVVAGTDCGGTPVTGTISASNGNRTYSFTASGLANNTQHSTCVRNTITDAGGSDIGSHRTISWTTVAAPTVANSNPANSATGVALSPTVTVTFNQTMNATTVNSAYTVRQTDCSGTVVSTGSPSTADNITFSYSISGLTANTTYATCVTTGAQSSGGTPLGSAYTATWTTVGAPTVSSSVPASAATGVALAPTVSVTFNQAMNSGTITTSSFYAVQGTNCGGTALTGTITNPSGNTFQFSLSGLTASTQYTTCVTTAVQSSGGVNMAGQYTASWTTGTGGSVTLFSFTDAGTLNGLTAKCVVSSTTNNTTLTNAENGVWDAALLAAGSTSLGFGNQGANGLSVLATGTVGTIGPTNCSTGTGSFSMGVMDKTINGTGRTGITVSWTGRTITASGGCPTPRTFAIRLQYSGDGGTSYSDVPGPSEYVSNCTSGHSQAFADVALPGSADNNPNIILRWRYYAVDTAGSGTRPKLAIDEITVRGN